MHLTNPSKYSKNEARKNLPKFLPKREVKKLPKTKKLTPKKQMAATKKIEEQSLLQKLQDELQLNQSYVSLVLGLLIVLVAGILVFNYFKKSQENLGPAQQTVAENENSKDVDPNNLPGKYTVKEGDTLFSIAQNYYKDGYKFINLVEANKLANENVIEVGQVLDIPKLESADAVTAKVEEGTGGAVNQTIWGEKITGETYTVIEGDWLSKIAGRAYGDVMAFDKIAKANNISDPNVIEPGTVLQIPR